MPDASLTVGETARGMAAEFHEAGLPEASSDARLLTAAACGLTRENLLMQAARPLTGAELAKADEFRRRRLGREPASRILGRREFWSQSFSLNAATLDPRADSETLIETALDIVDFENWRARPLRILDLGTGSGCLLLSLLKELPHATGRGIDLATEAVRAASDNAESLGLSGRAAFTTGYWLKAVQGRFDIIVSNPPYIPAADLNSLPPEVADWDPHLALDGGGDGLEAYRAIVEDLPGASTGDSWVLLEVGRKQAGAVRRMLAQHQFSRAHPAMAPIRDIAGIERVVAGKRQAGAASAEC